MSTHEPQATATTGPAAPAGSTGSTGSAEPAAPMPADRPVPPLPLLPALGAPVPERADAARNRRKILDAAARIVAENGPEAVTMNQVAQASGIGVGTVYRRFGEVSQLLWALLDERERRFQETYLSGPPPLGPGAPATQRLYAFLCAYVDHVVDQRALLLAAQTASPTGRYTNGAYLATHAHVRLLLAETRPTANAPLLAHLLLAPFCPSLMHHLTEEQHLSPDELKAGIRQLLHGETDAEPAAEPR
ncbi:TetR/AcrR family transcriptional regulator [Streptomyces sp. NPDC048717]|uniref:TetR/AcrR family transcriptional regulator n=1 Tax=Streptomyces sp. NPDC048717 TaxID=3154928 RepID=UPI0034452465